MKSLIALACALCFASSSPAADLIVSPDGPLTLQQAIAAARGNTEPRTILVQGGTYFLDAPITLTPADSSLTITAAPGETPILSGGVRLRGWTVKDGKWTLDLPEVRAGKWRFSQLWVNGERRLRPRASGGKYLYIESPAPVNDAFKGEGDNRFHYAAGDINPDWKNRADLELCIFHSWTMSRLPIDSIDSAARLISLRGRTGHSTAAGLGKGVRYLVENVSEELKQPGEWYLDRPAGTLTYIPLAGEDPEKAEVIAPRLERLVSIEGEKITLRGLSFIHSNWNMPPDGHSTGQAEMPVRGAVFAQSARSITLDNCTIAHVGHYGIEFAEKCENITIIDCELYDLAAGGMRLGTGWGGGEKDELISSRFTVRNNRITGGGRMHPGAVGIWIGHSPHNVIEHNEISDNYYTGISVGWRWGAGFSHAHHNRIAFNRIIDIGKGRMDDMGGIYTLGESPGTLVSNNTIQRVERKRYGGHGIYLDEGSAQIIVENNFVSDCQDCAFNLHYGRDNIARNNILARSATCLIGLGRPDVSGLLTITGNVLIPSNPALMGNGSLGANHKFERNAYAPATTQPLRFPGDRSFEQWQAAGYDAGSILLPANTPADEAGQKITFKKFDPRAAGRTPDARPLPATRPVADTFPRP